MVGMALYYWHGSGWPLITFWIHRNSRNRFLFFQFKSSLNIAALLIELKCSFKINASCSIPWCPCCSNVPAKITSFLREVPFKEKHSENQIPSLCTLDPTNVAGRLTAKYNHLYTMVRAIRAPTLWTGACIISIIINLNKFLAIVIYLRILNSAFHYQIAWRLVQHTKHNLLYIWTYSNLYC